MHLSPVTKGAAVSLLDEAVLQIFGDILETKISPEGEPGAEKTKGLESLRFPSRFQAPLLARSTGLEPMALASAEQLSPRGRDAYSIPAATGGRSTLPPYWLASSVPHAAPISFPPE
jgi:hypothetical protein